MIMSTYSTLGFSQTMINKSSETLDVLLSLSTVGNLHRSVSFQVNEAVGYSAINTLFHATSESRTDV